MTKLFFSKDLTNFKKKITHNYYSQQIIASSTEAFLPIGYLASFKFNSGLKDENEKYVYSSNDKIQITDIISVEMNGQSFYVYKILILNKNIAVYAPASIQYSCSSIEHGPAFRNGRFVKIGIIDPSNDSLRFIRANGAVLKNQLNDFYGNVLIGDKIKNINEVKSMFSDKVKVFTLSEVVEHIKRHMKIETNLTNNICLL